MADDVQDMPSPTHPPTHTHKRDITNCGMLRISFPVYDIDVKWRWSYHINRGYGDVMASSNLFGISSVSKPYFGICYLWTYPDCLINWWSERSYIQMVSLIARFMGPTWGPSGADRTQVGPRWAPWTLLSEMLPNKYQLLCNPVHRCRALTQAFQWFHTSDISDKIIIIKYIWAAKIMLD